MSSTAKQEEKSYDYVPPKDLIYFEEFGSLEAPVECQKNLSVEHLKIRCTLPDHLIFLIILKVGDIILANNRFKMKNVAVCRMRQTCRFVDNLIEEHRVRLSHRPNRGATPVLVYMKTFSVCFFLKFLISYC